MVGRLTIRQCGNAKDLASLSPPRFGSIDRCARYQPRVRVVETGLGDARTRAPTNAPLLLLLRVVVDVGARVASSRQRSSRGPASDPC